MVCEFYLNKSDFKINIYKVKYNNEGIFVGKNEDTIKNFEETIKTFSKNQYLSYQCISDSLFQIGLTCYNRNKSFPDKCHF